MGRCEKERADFNQQADHPFRPAIFGDSRQTLFFAHGHVEQTHHVPVRSPPSIPPSTHCTIHSQTMLFGPLGPSLAPYVRSSRTLSKWLKPIATWYANLSGYRRVGLVYDDLRASLHPHLSLPLIKVRALPALMALVQVTLNTRLLMQSLRSVQMSKGCVCWLLSSGLFC